MRVIALLLALCGAAASSAHADVGTRVQAAFEEWARSVGATDAALTYWVDGQPVRDVVLGRMHIDAPVELASLSKAITAACAVSLIRDGVMTAETTTRQVLDAGPEGLTLAALLTHSSGLSPDETQVLMPLWFDSPVDGAEVATARALARPATGDSGYFYNNENYAVAGEMITAAAGGQYQAVCRDRVLVPAGVLQAEPSPRSGAFLPFGGWQMPLHDYARFLNWAYGPEGVVGSDAVNLPAKAVSQHIYYGMGMFQRAWGPGYNFWHFGALCLPGRMEVGSYAVRWQNGVSIVASYDACLEDTQMFALDQAMVKAVFH